jgi:L-rhamnose mutarotase
MCFVSNSDLIISTELQNYGVHLNSEKLFGDFEQEEETSEDIVNYLTTQPKEKNK